MYNVYAWLFPGKPVILESAHTAGSARPIWRLVRNKPLGEILVKLTQFPNVPARGHI